MTEVPVHRFFGFFSPAAARSLYEASDMRTVPAETVLFEEDDPPDVVYLVRTGKVELAKRLQADRFEVIALAGDGDYFGELAVLDGSGRSTRARTLVRTDLLCIPASTVLDRLREDPGSAALSVCAEIVHHVRTTNERYLSHKLTQEKMALVGEMAGAIVHDLRGPYNGIQLAIDMIRETHDDAETRELCALVTTQIRRSLSMLEELLQFARGTTSLNRQAVSLRELLERFVRLNKDFLAQTRVSLIVDVDPVVVFVDEDKIFRVLQNLVNNAVEALGTRAGTVRIHGHQEGEAAHLRVEDDGPGLPVEVRQRLFQPFVTHGKRGGTGLGMPITKSIIEAHGGRIRLERSSSEGTGFLIEVPVAAALGG